MIILAAIAGGLGPWITLGMLSRSGVDAGADAIIAIALGVLGGLLVATKRSRILTGIVGALLVGIAVVDGLDVASRGDELLSPSPGWGLYLTGLVGVALIASAFVSRTRHER